MSSSPARARSASRRPSNSPGGESTSESSTPYTIHRNTRKPLAYNPVRSRCSRAWECCNRILDAATQMYGQLVYVNGEKVAHARVRNARRHTVRLHRDSAVRHRADPARGARHARRADRTGAAGYRLRTGRRRCDRHAGRRPRASRRCARGISIGADGAHSAVRKALGLTFEGAAFEEQYMLGDVEVDWSLPRG